MTPQQALARIAALCDKEARAGSNARWLAHMRAILADVTPETGVTLDREKARAVLTDYLFRKGIEPTLDALVACVRPVAGVTLTPEDAALVVKLIRLGFDESDDAPAAVLAARLEATQ